MNLLRLIGFIGVACLTLEHVSAGKKLRLRVKALEKNATMLDSTVKMLNSNIQEINQEIHSESVVFSARLATAELPRMGEPTKVVFDYVFTNAGDGYDTTSGIFTAPKAGYYSISASMISQHDSRFFVMMNDQTVEYLASVGNWEGDSVTVNLKLAEGDRVWIEGLGVIFGFNDCAYTKQFGAKYKCNHSSFSGFLIKGE